MTFTKILICCSIVLVAVYLPSVAGNLQEKASLNLFPSVTTCNYTQQGGSTCLSCSESLYCFYNNVGLRWQCSGLLSNCNNGHCSITKSNNCTDST